MTIVQEFCAIFGLKSGGGDICIGVPPCPKSGGTRPPRPLLWIRPCLERL